MTFSLGATKSGINTSGLWGAIGDLGSAVIQGISSASAAKKAYKYSKKLMQYQYDLNQRSLLESPSHQRKGLTDAGYNAMLAIMNGQYPTSGISNQGAVNPDIGNTITNSRMASIAKKTAAAQIENTNANTQKQLAEAYTESFRPELLKEQTINQGLMNILTQKDISWYEKERLADIYLKYSTGMSSLSNAKTSKEMLQVTKDSTIAEQEYRDEHPVYNWVDRWSKAISPWTQSVSSVTGASMISNAMRSNNSSGYDMTTQRFDRHGNYRGHTRTSYRKK